MKNSMLWKWSKILKKQHLEIVPHVNLDTSAAISGDSSDVGNSSEERTSGRPPGTCYGWRPHPSCMCGQS